MVFDFKQKFLAKGFYEGGDSYYGKKGMLWWGASVYAKCQGKLQAGCTTPQHLVCRVVQSLHTNHMQMSIVEVFICRRLHMNTSMIPVCI